MPILDDPRREQFCQHRAAGKTQDEAYRLAGYKSKTPRSHATQLVANSSVVDRIRELQAKTVEKFEVTAESMAIQFMEDRNNAIKWGQGSAAHAASVSLAKLFGLMTEKISVEHSFNLMSEQELRNELAVLVAEARSLRPGVTH